MIFVILRNFPAGSNRGSLRSVMEPVPNIRAVLKHGRKLPYVKVLVFITNSPLEIKHITFSRKLQEHSNRKQNWQQNDKDNDRNQYVKQSFLLSCT